MYRVIASWIKSYETKNNVVSSGQYANNEMPQSVGKYASDGTGQCM